MMKILYDDPVLNMPFGGVGKYFSELIKNLPADFSYDIAARTVQSTYFRNPPFNFPEATHTFRTFLPWLNVRGKSILYKILSATLPGLVRSCEMENRRLFVEKLKKGSFDILHLTDPHSYSFEWEPIVGRKPVVMTVHDLIPDMQPQNKRIRAGRAKALRLVDAVIAVSENTKKDIVRLYGTPAHKIAVVYHGHDNGVISGGGNLFPGMRYILYVGGRTGYKNFSAFSRVAADVLRLQGDLHLVCTGGELSATERKPFYDSGVSNRIHSLYVKDGDMMSLYANALLFVYPSKYEGFGIPILDAFHAGCPVLLSDSSCFPEVGGDAALYFRAENNDDMREKMVNIINDHQLRKKMIALGKARVREFSWEKCATDTAKIYRALCEEYVK